MGLSLLPFIIVVVVTGFLSSRSDLIEMQLTKLEAKARFLVRLKKERNRFIQEFGSSDANFLANYIESEVLLEKDITLLQEIQKISEYGSYKPINERVRFLTGEENKIHFEKVAEEVGGFFTQSHYKLAHPVEMNCDDVKNMLALIEGVKIDRHLPNPLRPQLIITSFDLTLKPQDNTNKVYFVNLEVMQRGCHEKSHS